MAGRKLAGCRSGPRSGVEGHRGGADTEPEGASGGVAPDRGKPVEVSSLRRGVPGLRYAPPRVAGSGRLGLQDLSGLQRPAGPVPGARSGDDPGAVVGGEFEVHGPVRGGGDRVAEGSERQGGRRADATELERGRRNHATCGGAGTCAPQDGSGPAPFGGRDLVPASAPIRHRGVESGDWPRPACRPGKGQGCAHGVLRGHGGEVPGGRRERQHGHVGALHLGDSGDDPGCRDEDRVRPVPCGQAPRRRGGQGAAGGASGAGEGGQTGSSWAPGGSG